MFVEAPSFRWPMTRQTHCSVASVGVLDGKSSEQVADQNCAPCNWEAKSEKGEPRIPRFPLKTYPVT